EAAELPRPRRLDQPYRAIGQLHARHSHLEKAFVLKEVQMPIALRLRVIRGMLACDLRMGETAAGPEVHVNGERTSGGIEPCLSYIPRRPRRPPKFPHLWPPEIPPPLT